MMKKYQPNIPAGDLSLGHKDIHLSCPSRTHSTTHLIVFLSSAC